MELITNDISQIEFNNHRFSLTNGQVYLMGVLEENPVKKHAVFIVNDRSKQKHIFNPLFSIIKVNDKFLSLKFHTPIKHYQKYDLKADILYRQTKYIVDGIEVTLSSERFLDKDKAFIYTQFKFMSSGEIDLDFYHGIDDASLKEGQGVSYIKSKLHEIVLKSNEDDYTAIIYNKDFNHKNRGGKNLPTEHYTIKTEANRQYRITKVIGYGPRIRELKKSLKYKMNQSYEKIKKAHIAFKKRQFKKNKMNIVNYKKLDLIMSYVTRQHLNKLNTKNSLNQTGLEDFTRMVYYIFNDPKLAKEILLAKIKMLEKYKINARNLNKEGALLLDDLDKSPSENITIYQGALFIFLLNLYQKLTGDFSLLEKGALDLSIEICNFYMDYPVKNGRNYDFYDVSNINHTIHHINNHTLTNYLIKHAFELTRELIKFQNKPIITIKEKDFSSYIEKLKAFERKIYLQKPNKSGIIFPYQNFKKDFNNQRLDIDNKDNIFLLDNLLLFIFFNRDYSLGMIKTHISYYSQIVKENSLNQIFLKLILNDIISDEDLDIFIKSVSVDQESLLISRRGIDLGVLGLVYFFVIYQFCGLRFDGVNFKVDSLIPKAIRRIEFDIKYKKYIGQIKIKRNSSQIYWND